MTGENQDITIVCVSCEQEFVWTAGEQRFYKEKELEQPKLCHICRGIKKAEQADREQYSE